MDHPLQALSDPIRRDILRMLRDAPQAAGTIAEAFPVSRPAVSRHLRVLREAGLVRDTASGRERVYSLVPEALAEIAAFVAELRAAPDQERADWERRFMALDTEVQRVRAQRKVAPPVPVDRRRKEAG